MVIFMYDLSEIEIEMNIITSSVGLDIGISAELFVRSSDSCCVKAKVPLSDTWTIDHIVSEKKAIINSY